MVLTSCHRSPATPEGPRASHVCRGYAEAPLVVPRMTDGAVCIKQLAGPVPGPCGDSVLGNFPSVLLSPLERNVSAPLHGKEGRGVCSESLTLTREPRLLLSGF